jgi:UDPglucose 6-dehydrogenase
MRVVVIGAGAVGLVSAACLAEIGHEVTCIDGDRARIAALRAGRSPIYEPGLDALIRRLQTAGRLTFAETAPDLGEIQLILLAIATPRRGEGTRADLRSLMATVDDLAPQLGERHVVVVKSAVPPGTADVIEARLRAVRPDLSPVVVANPEFLREGAAIEDFRTPDRIVVGSDSPAGCQALDELYQPITARGAPILFIDRRTAELAKYAAGAFLAAKIGLINELADLCEAIGADVGELARGVGLDRRIGADFLEAGPGFGGAGLPEDLRALLEVGQEAGVRLGVLAELDAANEARKAGLAERVVRALDGELAGRRIAVLGLTFKPDADSLEGTPPLALVERLIAAGARVTIYDPRAAGAVPGAVQATDPYECAADADALVLATHWNELRRLDPRRLAAAMAGRVIIDLRNSLNAAELVRAGFTIHAVGRSAQTPDGAAASAPARAPIPFASRARRADRKPTSATS